MLRERETVRAHFNAKKLAELLRSSIELLITTAVDGTSRNFTVPREGPFSIV